MLNKKENIRYSRHVSLDNVGIEGQLKLKRAKVLVVGAGGLGCPVLQYLAAAGVGNIGIVDGDKIDISNLQRQVLYGIDDVGKYKSDVAKEKLLSLNNEIQINSINIFLSRDNILSIIDGYDIVIDGSDNFETRYLVNDACIIKNKILVYGSIFKFEGQISVFNYQSGPSLRCLYPEAPDPNSVPNCSEVGVIGVLPGIIGTIMASEAIKIILDIGKVLSGKLLLMDVLNNHSIKLEIIRNNKNFERAELEESYTFNCENVSPSESISPIELNEWINSGKEFMLLDVRESYEREICLIESSISIPLSKIQESISKIPKDKTIVVYCHHGKRSQAAINQLKKENFKNLINLEGGIHAWAMEIDSTISTY
ncbi:MAG: molybdopterin-synthase adenylyltransferase MoeB [Bacteroidia bacterium]